jgi:hypothetical protein
MGQSQAYLSATRNLHAPQGDKSCGESQRGEGRHLQGLVGRRLGLKLILKLLPLLEHHPHHLILNLQTHKHAQKRTHEVSAKTGSMPDLGIDG